MPPASEPTRGTRSKRSELGYDGLWHFEELGVLVKFGNQTRVHIEEALALRVINKMFPTSQIPAPEVFGWKSTGGVGYKTIFVYMSCMPGQKLGDVWDSLSDAEKQSVSQQLAEITTILRSVEQDPANQFIGSLNHGPVQDIYFAPNHHKGPFLTVQEFHDFVQFVALYMVPMAKRPPELYRAMLPDTARICLTHGDLHLGNILVVVSQDGDEPKITISGIVDWEQAGWYPEYWEYCKAMIVGPYGDDWRENGWVNIALQVCENEYEGFEEY